MSPIPKREHLAKARTHRKDSLHYIGMYRVPGSLCFRSTGRRPSPSVKLDRPARRPPQGILLAGWTVLHDGGAGRLTLRLPLCGDPRTNVPVQRHESGRDAQADSIAWRRGA